MQKYFEDICTKLMHSIRSRKFFNGEHNLLSEIKTDLVIKGIVQPFELGGETRLIRSYVKK
jgi:hypothetical protein